MKRLLLFFAACTAALAQFTLPSGLGLTAWKGTGTDTNLLQLWLPLAEASGDAVASTGPNFTQSGTVGALSPGRGTYTTNDYFSHSDSFAPNLASNNFTVTAWVKSAYYYTNNYSTVIASGTSTNWNFALLGPYNDGTDNIDAAVQFSSSTNTTLGVGTSGYITDVNTWNFIAATLDRSLNKGTVFVNGTNKTSQTWPTTINSPSSQTFKVGTIVSGTNSPFTGHIQHLRIYTRLLSDAEIQTLYNGGTPN